jgi:tripartite-type tricarboxylate transporter receptor subunit TctC
MPSTASRRHWLVASLAGALSLSAAAAAAQAYPSRPITIIVPQTPGGGSDIITRAVTQEVAQILGQAVVIDNRNGAGGNIGTALAARAKPDGYTLLMSSVNHTINPALYSRTGYDPKDFVPAALMATGNMLLAVRADSPIKDLKSFIAASRGSATQLTYGSPGNGTVNHLAIAVMEHAAGLNFMHVPYAGAPAASNAVVAGQVDFSFLAPASSAGLISSGKPRGLGMTGTRMANMPGIPAIGELVPGYDVTPWYGIFAVKGTPPEVVATLNRAFNEAQARPALKAKLAEQGIVTSALSQVEFAKMIDDELLRWKEAVERSGARVE